MKQLSNMSKDERSLLLYIETVATDHAGLLDMRKLNEEDVGILKEWNKSGFVEFGRLTFASMNSLAGKQSHRVLLTIFSWRLAQHRIALAEARNEMKGWES